jgi:sugar phosphate isomerase/epimerase
VAGSVDRAELGVAATPVRPDDSSASRISLPPFSVSACTTFHSTPFEDIAICSAASVDGIGLWEFKLPEGGDDEIAALMQDAGLRATFCFPNVKSLLPGDAFDLRFAFPLEPRARARAMHTSIRRLARFDPLAVVLLAGPPGNRSRQKARSEAVDRLRAASDVAGEAGVSLALEVIRAWADWSLTRTITEAIEFIDAAGVSNVDVLIDLWHFWDGSDALADLATYHDRVVCVQISDRPRTARGAMDRVLPGQGGIPLASLMACIQASGFSGWYELEIISDDGTFGDAYADSLWRRDPAEVVRLGWNAFRSLWTEQVRVR